MALTVSKTPKAPTPVAAVHVTPVKVEAQPASTLDNLRRVAGTSAHSKLTKEALMLDLKIGVGSSLPMEGVFQSQKYRRGETKANEYVAGVISNSLGFGAWTVGGALATAALAPIGLPVFVMGVAGFAAGMIANDLFDRTAGKGIKKFLTNAIDAKKVKPFADGFTRFVANPLVDYIWNPISHTVMKHKVLSGVAVGALALRFPFAAKAVLKEATVWIGGTAIAMGAQMGLINKILPEAKEEGKATKTAATESADDAIDPKLIEAYQKLIKKFTDSGATPAQAASSADKWFNQTLAENGVSPEDAQSMTRAIAAAAK